MGRSKMSSLAITAVLLAAVGACAITDQAAPNPADEGAAPEQTLAPIGEPIGEEPAENAAFIEAPDDATEPAGDPVVIGLTGGLTGFMSVFDLPVQAGMKMAIEDLNASGGLLGRPVELVTTDNGSDVAKIQTAAESLLENGADVAVVSCDYDMGGPAARALSASGVIAFGCAGAEEYGVQDLGPMVYNMNSGTKADGSSMAEYLVARGLTKPFLITDYALQFTQTMGETFTERASELGLELVGEAEYQNGDASAAAQIAAIHQTDADVIVVASYPPGGATLLHQIRGANIDLPLVIGSGFDGVYWLDAVADPGDMSVLVPASLYGDDFSEVRNTFFERFEDETGEAAASGMYPAFGYSMVQAFAIAVEEAGSLDSNAVRAALDSFDDEPLLIGATTYAPQCHIPTPRPYHVISYAEDEPRVIDYVSGVAIPGVAPC